MGFKVATIIPKCFGSEKKKRMVVVGGDRYKLDISYITERILAMSFPSELMRSMYQNPMTQVKKILEKRHPGHYKVYNLSTEQAYDPSHFKDLVERFPFDDNHAPSLQMIKEFCESVHSWLSSDPKNIVFVHCMEGKGRIGLMVSSYLVYAGILAEETHQVYADKGTTKYLQVMIPSQRRYVNYWHKSLTFSDGCSPKVNLPKQCSKEIRKIRLFDTKTIESVFFVVSEMQEVAGQRYRSPAVAYRNFCRKSRNDDLGNSEIEEEEQRNCLDHYFNEKTIQVTGDVCLIFYEKNIGGRLFYACFNTAFIENDLMKFSITELDKVGNKGKSIAGDDFRVELLFSPANRNTIDS
ncbi:unnamed protein product [Lactuca saligna]|uniref:Phosphatidylinositol-3,4,5-trisphosphate 3-phosphatase n=1 Tax=Lactuca saligna TaxID=75948 RepID=A0AA35YMS8_LACSI|nr:unnamed protein product [Lactuca saligna]